MRASLSNTPVEGVKRLRFKIAQSVTILHHPAIVYAK
jgi:hypothetical protein